MFLRKGERRVRAVAAAVAELRGADLVGRGAEGDERLALAAEAIARVTGQPVSDKELAAGIALCDGAALDDGDVGDTSVLLALPTLYHANRGVHHVSATERDAARHAEWLRPVAAELGLRVGLLEPGGSAPEADIVCGVVDEFAYDGLRAWLSGVPFDRRVAVVDDLDIVLLDRGGATPTITAPREEDTLEWRRWAEDTAARLALGQHFTRHGQDVSLTPSGIDHILGQVDLTDVYRDHVPVFPMVRAVLTGTAETRMALASTTVRNHLLRYELVTGVGVVDETAARRLRELYDLPARPRKADVPAHDDVVCADDDALRAAVLAAVRASDRPVIVAAATDELTAFAPDGDVLGPDDPIPHGPHLLVGIGRHRTRRRDLRLARAAADARFFMTTEHVADKGGRELRPRDVTAQVARWQANDELAGHYFHADGRVEADVREAHLDDLTARCAALDADAFPQVLHDHLDTLTGHYRDGDLGYRELLDLLGELYPCALPTRPPADLAAAVRTDADRALAERIVAVGGADILARLIQQVVASVRDKLWRAHLVNLETLMVVCRHTIPPRRLAAGFTERAGQQFDLLWLELVAETISYVFMLRFEPDPR
jgi:hypothetical protein